MLQHGVFIYLVVIAQNVIYVASFVLITVISRNVLCVITQSVQQVGKVLSHIVITWNLFKLSSL